MPENYAESLNPGTVYPGGLGLDELEYPGIGGGTNHRSVPVSLVIKDQVCEKAEWKIAIGPSLLSAQLFHIQAELPDKADLIDYEFLAQGGGEAEAWFQGESQGN
ncbi:hypothetical protein N7462_006099 [Penicillium macrosclerotiorum]|uniref:uncharacterized protein n=1 Tax=Penicillium macrosclerotiorum TaxID=303699 RepID=UPI002549B793|nr:uncharacterized protein N7462_006099 [Penicillium macrosclerotiorum]KAJ5682934.1 hypothetical protein N7462_006099 [Penicillium macrosclerotiorum]